MELRKKIYGSFQVKYNVFFCENAKATTFLEMALFIKVKLCTSTSFSCRHQISITTADKRIHAGILSDSRNYDE